MLITTATRLPLIMACNGSRNMPPATPDNGDRTQRDEGDAAHWLAKAVFDGTHPLEEMGDRKAPNGVHISTDMCDHVGEYLSALVCGEMEADTSFVGESWQVNGRTDHIAFDAPAMTLYVDEFKYGWRLVEPFMNWTLISHAIGYCVRRQITPATIIFRVHQPRPHHRLGKLREWRITYLELMGLYARLDLTLSNPPDMLQTGPHCSGCFAVAHCPAARRADMNARDAIEETTFVDDIPNDLLAEELDALRAASVIVERRLKAFEELANHRIINGGVVPNYHAETQLANRAFKPGIDAPILQVLTGADMSKSGTVTPPEAERRLVAKGMTKAQAKATLEPFTYRATTGVKIVREEAHARAKRLLTAQ